MTAARGARRGTPRRRRAASAATGGSPRSPLAWATQLYPFLVFVVVVGTANHFFLDALVGIACAAIGVAGALLIHGRVPRGRSEAGPSTIALMGITWGAIAFAVNVVVMSFAG